MPLANQPVDLVIDKGARLSKSFTWKDENDTPMQLAAKKARLQIRESDMSSRVLVTLSTEAGETPDGTITLGNTAPNIVLYLAASVTETLDWEDAVYDLKIYTTTDDADSLFGGKVTVCTGTTSVQ